MLRTKLAELFRAIISELVGEGRLPSEVLQIPIEISDPKNPEHGDFACNFALMASKAAGMNPRALGEALAEKLGANFPTIVSGVEVAGPGFINLRLHASFVAGHVETVLTPDFKLESASKASHPLKVNVEFVSVNPNGPITIGSGRGAAYGSTLCKILEAVGHTVHREYYINDGVNSEQMRLFAESVRAIVNKLPIPKNGYRGDYVHEVAEKFANDEKLWDSIIQQFIDEIDARSNLWKHFADELNRDLEALVAEQKQFLAKIKNQGISVENRAEIDKEAKEYSQRLEILKSKAADIKVKAASMDHERKSVEFFSENVEFEEYRKSALVAAIQMHSLQKYLPVEAFQAVAQEAMLRSQRETLLAFGVQYDTWFSEQSLHNNGLVESEIDSLIRKGIADYSLTRTKLKMAKGGKIEDVIHEVQGANTVEEEDEVHLDDLVPTPIPVAEPSMMGSIADPDPLEQINPTPDHITTLDEEEIDREISEGSPVENDGVTLWLRSAKLGDDMDRVLRRRDGRLTYIASDVAYHKDKFNRPAGADKLITVLGPDHHGYIGRLTAVVAAMMMEPPKPGEPLTDEIQAKLFKDSGEKEACDAALAKAKKQLEVQIFQLVRFVKDGKPAPMRKRDGNIYALIDLMKEIGVKLKPEGTEAEQLEAGKDVARFFYLMRSHDTTFDFDLDLAEKQSDENPVFYVQYAHARICSVLAKAEAALGAVKTPDLSALLVHDREKALIKKIVDLPDEIRRASEDYGVHRIATYSIELARTFHYFYDGCRVIQEDQPELSAARMKLCEATKRTLKTTLDLLGVSAPEKM